MASDNDYLRAAEALLKIANDMELTQLSGQGTTDPADAGSAAPEAPTAGAEEVTFVCQGCGNSVPLSEINAARIEAAGGEAIDPIEEGDSVHCPACKGGIMSVGTEEATVPKEASTAVPQVIQSLYKRVPKETLLKAMQTPISALERIGEKVIGAVVRVVDEHDDVLAKQDAQSHGIFPLHEEEKYNLKSAGMADQFSSDPHGDESLVTSIVLYALEKGLTSMEELKKAGPATIGELLTKVQAHMKGDTSLTHSTFSVQASGLLPALSVALPTKLLSIVKEDSSSLNNPHAVDIAKAVQGMTEEDAAKAVRALVKAEGATSPAMKTAGAVSYKAMLAAVLGLAAATMAGEGKPTQSMKADLTAKHWANLETNVAQASEKNEALRQLVYSMGQYAHNTATNALSEAYDKDDTSPADSSVAMGGHMQGKVQDPSSAKPAAPDVWETRSASFAMVAGIDMDRLHRYL